MTDIDVDVETAARRIADRGQDALVSRLRAAYADAAAAHADLISLDDEQIEAMVQAAAEKGDGLQWRRALADVAAEELGISATEALTHPAVARAQALVGAPSYEQSLAELIARPVPPSAPPAPSATADSGNGWVSAPPEPMAAVPEPVTEQPADELEAVEAEPGTETPEPMAAVPEPVTEQPADELEAVEADDVVLELLPEPDPIEYETEVYDVEASFTEEEAPPTLEPEPFSAAAADEAVAVDETAEIHQAAGFDETQQYGSAVAAPELEASVEESELIIPAIHLGGVANLPTKRDGLGVRLSADGLDILQGDRDIIGRLVWDEIEALEVPNLRARRRRHEPRARLVVRTPHGDASFDVPGISGDELRDRVEPLFRLFGHR